MPSRIDVTLVPLPFPPRPENDPELDSDRAEPEGEQPELIGHLSPGGELRRVLA
jgi:hypothetical protein